MAAVRYWNEPAKTVASDENIKARTAVVLVNTGTPAAPTETAVRRYLAEFLSDPRIIESPRMLWLPVLHGVVLRRRPRRSAAKYKMIWMQEGSPLSVHTERQKKLLKGRFAWQGQGGKIRFAYAMRYGQPALAEVLHQLKHEGCERFLLIPMFPQYSATTTASIIDELARCLRYWRNVPEVRFIRQFHLHEAYLDALAASVREHWQKHGGAAEKLLISFHGMPESYANAGDPYQQACLQTAHALTQRLSLSETQWQLTFQSRFGRAHWLRPYTEPTLIAAARAGLRSVDVICPGFVADCLETLEEIAIGCKKSFLDAGGTTFRYIPCLNERDDWIAALAQLTSTHLADWLEDDRQK